jgi:NTE family protein
LVLGGGGVGGIAWITGLLAGLAEAGQDVTGADVLVGTSAGSTVAAQLGSGLGLEKLYSQQIEPGGQSTEIMVDLDRERRVAEIGAIIGSASTVPEMRRAVGTFALHAATVPERERRAVIESRLPSREWPTRTLKIVAVDAETGEPRVFENTSGVSLVDAVTASCAVPGVWPPATIDGRRYVDGSVRSSANADYAAGASRVLVIVPLGTVELRVESGVSELSIYMGRQVMVLPESGRLAGRARRAWFGRRPLVRAQRHPTRLLATAERCQGRRRAHACFARA